MRGTCAKIWGKGMEKKGGGVQKVPVKPYIPLLNGPIQMRVSILNAPVATTLLQYFLDHMSSV